MKLRSHTQGETVTILSEITLLPPEAIPIILIPFGHKNQKIWYTGARQDGYLDNPKLSSRIRILDTVEFSNNYKGVGSLSDHL